MVTKRVVAWLSNHDYDATALVADVLSRVAVDAVWLGSCVLANAETAGEYVVTAEGEDWYLKYYVDEEQMTVVVLSCWWRGTIH